MWYIILFLAIVILAICFYFIFNKDIMSPTFISCAIYALSVFSAYLSHIVDKSWNNVELHANTVIYIVIAIIAFGVGELIVRKLIKKYKNIEEKKDITFINVKISKLLICILFILLTFTLVYVNMKMITGKTNIDDVISEYRKNTGIYGGKTENEKINFIYNQMYRGSIVVGMVFLYIFVNNICYDKKVKKNYLNIIPAILAAFSSILLSGRSDIMRFVVAFAVFYIIIYTRKNKINIKKFIIVGSIALVTILSIFYSMLGIVGRTTKSNFFDYISFYLGAPISCLDLYTNTQKITLISSSDAPQHFGEDVFIGIQRVLNKIGVIDYYKSYARFDWIAFDTPHERLQGNVFTGIKVYLQDFGIIGAVICQILFGMTFSILYQNTKYKNKNHLIFYGMFSLLLIDQYRGEKLFTSLITIDTLIYIVEIIVVTWFIIDFDYKSLSKNNFFPKLKFGKND